MAAGAGGSRQAGFGRAARIRHIGEGRKMSYAVNSYDEWTALHEVIVGTPYHLDYHLDTSFRLFFHENIQDPSNHGVFGRIKPSNRLRDECEEDLREFVGI